MIGRHVENFFGGQKVIACKEFKGGYGINPTNDLKMNSARALRDRMTEKMLYVHKRFVTKSVDKKGKPISAKDMQKKFFDQMGNMIISTEFKGEKIIKKISGKTFGPDDLICATFINLFLYARKCQSPLPFHNRL